MKIEINNEDFLDGNIELARSLVTEALLFPDKERKAKKLLLAYKSLEKSLKNMGVNLQEFK